MSIRGPHQAQPGRRKHGDSPHPPFDFPCITDIKKALPKRCFEPSLLLSMYYVAKDLMIVATLWCCLVLIENHSCSYVLCAVWPCYWFLQGTMFWSLFVLGHDCGHGSFSIYPLFNDILGNLLHGVLLVPYYPWKLSHKHHHKNTSNIDREEIFYPVREADCNKDMHPLPGFGLGIAWFYYLLYGYAPRPVSHVNPYQQLLQTRFVWCLVSLATVVAMLMSVCCYGYYFGLVSMLNHYVVPCFVFASWLVVVTFLHHNDVQVPWYADSIWSNVGGQLSSVDRHYGWAHSLTHNIGTHQVHHLFSKIPHYRLEEATVEFRKVFPHLVRVCNDPILPSFWRMFKIFIAQRHITDDVSIHVYTKDK